MMDTFVTSGRPSTTVHLPRRVSTKRSSRIRLSSAMNEDRGNSSSRHSNDQSAVRNASHFADRFDKWDMYELLASRDAHWLLTNSDTYKTPTELPAGLTRQFQNFNESHIDILFPCDESIAPLDTREIHQLIREITIGVYSLNAHPSMSLEANHDLSSSCQIPPAYVDTRLGQIMVQSDAWLKSVWHGVFMSRERRSKFADRWRQLAEPSLTRSISNEYESSGLQELKQDGDYADAKKNFVSEAKSEEQTRSDDEFFSSFVDDLSMVLTVYLDKISQWKNSFMFNGNYLIQSQIKSVEEKLDNQQFQRLKALVQVHENYVRESFPLKSEVRRSIYLLELSCFLFTVLVGLKRRMKKVPNMSRLLSVVVGEDLRSERELAPLIYLRKYSSTIFPIEPEKMFHLHGGIQFEFESKPLTDELSQIFEKRNEKFLDSTRQTLYGFLDLPNSANVEYHVPIVEIDGKKFYHLVIDLEPYYGNSPSWIRSINDSLNEAAKKRVLNETIIYEMYKKYFGRKKATHYKNPENGLRICAQRGIACIFLALARKFPPSALSKPNIRDGMTLMHYAAIHNRPIIIDILISLGVDLNSRQEINYLPTGGTPLHLACRHGSYDAASCLLGNMASILTDHRGWTPIHQAAYCDHVPIIRLLYYKHNELLEQTTKDDRQSTALLLAASSGALDAVKCLVELNANVAQKDMQGYTVIHLAASNVHTNVIEYFIRLNHPQVPSWRILVDLILHPDLPTKRATVQCLHAMTTHGEEFWQPLLRTEGIQRLMSLLKSTDNPLILSTLSVLCNISTNAEVRQAISNVNEDLPEMFSRLLKSPNDEIRSKTSILIADVCFITSNQIKFVHSETIAGLSRMLASPIEDVLVNACNAIDLLCRKNRTLQDELGKVGIIEQLTELLALDSKVLRGTVASALASITYDNLVNQNMAASMGALRLIVDLMQDREFGIRYKASLAVEALALNNAENQKQFLSKHLNVQKPLNELMEKMYYVAATIRSSEQWALEIREQAAFSLWSLGGHIKTQQSYIAQCFGSSQIVTMLLSNSEKLQYVSLNAIIALSEENEFNQNRLHRENIFNPLIRLTKIFHQLSHRVLLVLVRSFGVLCIGVSMCPNILLQNTLVENRALEHLLRILNSTDSIEIKVECCLTLSKIVLNHHENQQRLSHEFNVERFVREFVKITDLDLKLRALLALSFFAYNNLENQCVLKQTNAILYNSFRPFIECDNPKHSALACFQVVILARVISDTDDEQVTLTALAIMKLVELLQTRNVPLITQIAKYVGSLARIRTGISDAFVSCEILDVLVEKLTSPSVPNTSEDAGDEVEMRSACSVAIGALSYNRTAFRLLYNAVRREPSLYEKLLHHGGRSCLSADFTAFFESERSKGLPIDSLSLQLHVLEARPASRVRQQSQQSSRTSLTRTKTAHSRLQTQPPSVLSNASTVTNKSLNRRRLLTASRSVRQ